MRCTKGVLGLGLGVGSGGEGGGIGRGGTRRSRNLSSYSLARAVACDKEIG